MRTLLEPSEYVCLSDLQRREFSGYSAILNQWAIATLASLTYVHACGNLQQQTNGNSHYTVYKQQVTGNV